MATNASTVILEQSKVAPSPGGATEKLLPLLDFDVMLLHFHPMQGLFFYDLRLSKSDFLETFVPTIKNSLSITLKHFCPLAGKIILPLTSSGDPISHYVAGDSVSFTIAQSDADFDHLTANHYRDGDDFYGLVPKLAQATNSADSIRFPVAAFQVTLFPDQGICLGITLHHAIADGATLVCLVRAWLMITKFKGESYLLASGDKWLPSYERSAIKERLPGGIWKHMRKSSQIANSASHANGPPKHNVRAVFTLNNSQIRELKKFVLNKLKPELMARDQVSSYVIVCAFLWTCFARSAGEDVADDEPVYIACTGDCRARLDPPLPETYFGNCIAIMLGESTHKRLRDREGMVEAAVAIVKAIQNTFGNNGNGVDFSGIQKLRKLNTKRAFFIVGSPTFALDRVDFGWGKPKAVEAMTVDAKESAFLGKSISSQGVQIGLSMSKVDMDAFVALFQQGIRESEEGNRVLSKM